MSARRPACSRACRTRWCRCQRSERCGCWLRTVPPTVRLHVADGAPSVLQSGDSRQRDTLACILTDSDDATADALPALALEQAALPAKRGGVGLISHIAICHAECRPFVESSTAERVVTGAFK